MVLKIKEVDTSHEYQDVLKIRKKVFIDEQKISEKIEPPGSLNFIKLFLRFFK